MTGANLAATAGTGADAGGTTRPSQPAGTENQSDRSPNWLWNCVPVTVTVAKVPTTSIERTRPPSAPRPLRAVTRTVWRVPICG